MTPEAETEFEQRIIANVREHGCHINVVGADPESDMPNFAYSVGFVESVGQPEVIVFGLPTQIMAAMINDTLHQCRAGLQLEDWTVVNGLLDGHRCIARAVAPELITPEHFNSALWYLRTTTGQVLTKAVQLVWPGADDGLFPWDEGCNDEVGYWQPPLYGTELNS